MPEGCQVSLASGAGALANALTPANRRLAVTADTNLTAGQEVRAVERTKSGCIGQRLLDPTLDGKLKNPGAGWGTHPPRRLSNIQRYSIRTSLAVEWLEQWGGFGCWTCRVVLLLTTH